MSIFSHFILFLAGIWLKIGYIAISAGPATVDLVGQKKKRDDYTTGPAQQYIYSRPPQYKSYYQVNL